MLERALETFESIGDIPESVTTFLLLAQAYLAIGDNARAENLSQQALERAQWTGDLPRVALSLRVKGLVMANRQPRQALELLSEAATHFETLGAKFEVASIYLDIARLYIRQSEERKATHHADLAWRLARDHNYEVVKEQAQDILSHAK